MTDPPHRWAAVGTAMSARIKTLGLTKAEVMRRADVSDKTLTGYLAGSPVVRADKARGMCTALEWPPDAIDRLLAGEDPADFDPLPTDPGGTVVMADELIGLAAIAGQLDPADRERWVEFGRGLAAERDS